MPIFYFKTDEFTTPGQRFKHEYEELTPVLDAAKNHLLDFAKNWIPADEGGAVKIEIVGEDLTPLANISLLIVTKPTDRR